MVKVQVAVEVFPHQWPAILLECVRSIKSNLAWKVWGRATGRWHLVFLPVIRAMCASHTLIEYSLVGLKTNRTLTNEYLNTQYRWISWCILTWELEGITSPCCLLISQYPHHMTICPPVAIVKRCYGIHLYHTAEALRLAPTDSWKNFGNSLGCFNCLSIGKLSGTCTSTTCWVSHSIFDCT